MSADNTSQAVIAARMNISGGALTNYLLGRLPKAEELLRISKHYNVTTDWLLKGDETASASRALRETPAEYRVDDLLAEIKTLKEQVSVVERAAKRLKP